MRNYPVVRYDSNPMQSFDSNLEETRKPERSGQTVAVGNFDDLPPGRSATVELLDGRELALYNVDGEFFAVENSCPHKGAPLVEGILCGHTLECGWHGWQFDVRTGKCFTTTSSNIEIFEVLIEDGLLKVIV